MGLSDRSGGEADAVLNEAAGPRRCERCEVVVEKPERVQFGAPEGVKEWHRCPDGEWGELVLVYPPPSFAGPEKSDPTIVDTTQERRGLS